MYHLKWKTTNGKEHNRVFETWAETKKCAVYLSTRINVDKKSISYWDDVNGIENTYFPYRDERLVLSWGNNNRLFFNNKADLDEKIKDLKADKTVDNKTIRYINEYREIIFVSETKDAAKKAVKKYNSKLSEIKIRVTPEEKEQIMKAAATAEMSMQEFILTKLKIRKPKKKIK